MRKSGIGAVCSLALLFTDCTKTAGIDSDTNGPTGPSGPSGNSGLTFALSTITVPGSPSSFSQTTVAAGGGKVAFAVLGLTSSTSPCTVLQRPTVQITDYSVLYGESTGGDFAVTSVASEPYTTPVGVGLAMSSQGQTTIAYLGTTAAKQNPQRACGGSNLLITTGSSGTFAPASTVASESDSGGGDYSHVPTSEQQNCSASSQQNVCELGDDVGWWPTVAYDKSGNAAVGFRDVHYGVDGTDFTESDVSYADAASYASQPTIEKVDVARGGGTYAHLVFTPNGTPTIVHYNGSSDQSNLLGIWMDQPDVNGIWQATSLSTDQIGEQLGFDISSAGTYGVAYYDVANPSLVYLESTDGQNWTKSVVDTNGDIGRYPSLAYDPTGEPSIAYYRCNDLLQNTTSCDEEKDGLWFANRLGDGSWAYTSVSNQSGVFDGTYPALTYFNGKAVIVYQNSSFDPGATTGQSGSQVQLNVAREQ